jgi:hypothetical protein
MISISKIPLAAGSPSDTQPGFTFIELLAVILTLSLEQVLSPTG